MGLMPWQIYRFTLDELNQFSVEYNLHRIERAIQLQQLAYNIGGCVRHANAEADYPGFDEIFPANPDEAATLSDDEMRAQAKAKGLKSPD